MSVKIRTILFWLMIGLMTLVVYGCGKGGQAK